MTFEQSVAGFISGMLLVIAYFIKRLINTVDTRLDTADKNITGLNDKLVDILQRLVRLEEKQLRSTTTKARRG